MLRGRSLNAAHTAQNPPISSAVTRGVVGTSGVVGRGAIGDRTDGMNPPRGDRLVPDRPGRPKVGRGSPALRSGFGASDP